MKRYVIVLLLVILAGAGGFFWTKRRLVSQASVKSETAATSPAPTTQVQPTPNFPQTLGDFFVTDEEVCQKAGKPLIYFFGSTSCPHCIWQKPVMKKVVEKFGNEVEYHENIDSQTDSEVFAKYANINPGYVPFLVLGCKYARVGSGETTGEEKEIEALTAIICKLTDGKPTSVCNALKDEISGIE